VYFEKDECRIVNDSVVIVGKSNESNLYQLIQNENVLMASNQRKHNENCLHSWHRRLGHRDIAAIKRLSNDGFSDGIKIVNCGIEQVCECCLEGKMSRLPFNKSTSKSTEILELVHTDLCGPMTTPTPSGNRYVLTFIDDFSKYTMVYFVYYGIVYKFC
jgi:hypothetical protein